MRTITERTIFCVFAGAEKRLFIGICRPRQRREVGAFMRSVAEGLVLRLAARAPIIGFTGFDVDGEGALPAMWGVVMVMFLGC